MTVELKVVMAGSPIRAAAKWVVGIECVFESGLTE
jgi:hypothetical protein